MTDKEEKIRLSLKVLILFSFLFVSLPSSHIQLIPLYPFNLPFFAPPLVLTPPTPPPLLRLLIFSSLPRQSSSPNLSLSPSSSTGTTSRRCSLDHRGMAFWEQPSYARCITNEFRYLQQSVGAKSAPSHSLCFQCTINYLPSVPLPVLITM